MTLTKKQIELILYAIEVLDPWSETEATKCICCRCNWGESLTYHEKDCMLVRLKARFEAELKELDK